MTNAGDGTVSRIPAGAGEVTQKLNVGAGPFGIAYGDGALWVADSIGGVLVRVDPNSGTTRPVPLSGQPSGVAFTPDGVWVSLSPAGISRVDPSTMTVTFTEDVGSGPTAVLPAFGSIWVANHLDGTVTRLEPSTGKELATIHVGDDPNALGAAAGSIWVEELLTKISPLTSPRSTRPRTRSSEPSPWVARRRPSRDGATACGWRSAHRPPSIVAGP